MAQLLQPSFSAGELAPELHARVDIARYLTGLKVCNNFYVRPTGGVTSRPGFEFLAPAQTNATASRLLRFVYAIDQACVVEVSAGAISVFQDGARVLTGASHAISAMTVSSGTVFVDTATAHGLTSGQCVLLSGINGTGVLQGLSGEWPATVVNTTRFAFTLPTTAAGTYLSGGTVQPCVFVANTYSADAVRSLRTAQSADVLYLFHVDHPVRELRRESATSWALVETDFENGPFQEENRDETLKIHASAETGAVTLTANRAVFTAEMVGGLIRLDARSRDEPVWEPTLPASIGNIRRYEENTYLCTANPQGVNTGTVPPTHTFGRQQDGSSSASKEWLYLHSGWGIVEITAYTSPTSVSGFVAKRLPAQVVGGATTASGPQAHAGDGTTRTFAIAWATSSDPAKYEATFDGVMQRTDSYAVDPVGNTITFNDAPASGVAISIRQLDEDNRTDFWSLGAWSPAQGYPRAGTFYEDRLVLGGSRTEPQGVWLSRTSDYTDFGTSTPVQDDDGLTTLVNSREINAVTDLVPLSRLIAVTSAGTWRVGPAGDAPITPSTISYKAQSQRGAADLPAVIVGEAALYLQYGARKLRASRFDFNDDAFTGDELTLTARHLLEQTPATGLASAEEPGNLLWLPRSDGAFLSVTYEPTQQVVGWAQHHTDGTVGSVCVIPEGGRDVLYAVITRTVGGLARQYIERLADRDEPVSRKQVHCDSALTYDGSNANTTTVTLTDTFGITSVVASAAVFAATDVGRDLWVTVNGKTIKATVTAYSSPTAVIISTPTGSVVVADFGVATTEWSFPVFTLLGLHHLAGKQVIARLDGTVEAALLTVSSAGTLTLPYPVATAVVGLPFDAYIETLPLTIVGRDTIRHREKTVPRVAVEYVASQGFRAGPSADRLETYPPRTVGDDWDAVPVSAGVGWLYLTNTWEDSGRFQVWANRGAPLTILSVTPDVKVGT